MTITNFINNYLKGGIEVIFKDFSKHLVEIENIDLEYAHIDGKKHV